MSPGHILTQSISDLVWTKVPENPWTAVPENPWATVPENPVDHGARKSRGPEGGKEFLVAKARPIPIKITYKDVWS